MSFYICAYMLLLFAFDCIGLDPPELLFENRL